MQHKHVILLMVLICAALALAYIFMGLNADNWNFNFPRRVKIIAAIVVVGAAIGLSAVTFQTVTGHHILTPGIIGLDSLYLFVQTVVVWSFGSGMLAMMNDLPSFLLTLLLMTGFSTLLFVAILRRNSGNIYFLVLVGFVCGTVFTGLSTFMQVIIDPSEFSVLEGRMFATFNRINTDLLNVAAIIVIAVYALTMRDFPLLDVLTLGRNQAINLGVNHRSIVMRSLIGTAIMISAATVLVGPITFLGIMSVSLARVLFKTWRHDVLVHGCFLLTTAILLLGMLLTERLFQFAAPLSVIINFVGGGYFLYLLFKAKHI